MLPFAISTFKLSDKKNKRLAKRRRKRTKESGARESQTSRYGALKIKKKKEKRKEAIVTAREIR